MFGSLGDLGFRVEAWRRDEAKYQSCRPRTSAQARASSLLRRRNLTAEVSDRFSPPRCARGFRRAGVAAPLVAKGDAHAGMLLTACIVARRNPGDARRVEGIRHRGGEGSAGGVATGGKEGGERGGKGEGEAEKKQAAVTGQKTERGHSSLGKLWGEAKHEKGHLAMGAVCLLVSSSMNLLAPTIMAKVIDRASRKGSTGGASSRSESSDALESMSDSTFFLGALGIFAVGSLASWGRIYALAMASAGVATRLRSRLFASLMLQEKEFFDKREPGTLVPVLVEDVKMCSKVFGDKMASILRSLNSCVNASLALLRISPSLTLVSISTVPIVGSVSMVYYKHVRKLTTKLREADSQADAFAQARLANVRTVRVFANEKLEAERFHEMVEKASKLRSREASATGFLRGGLFVMTGASLMAVFWVGGNRVGKGRMTAGQLTSFAGYTAMVGLGFSGLASGVTDVGKGLASAQRVFDLADRVPAVEIDGGECPGDRAAGEVEFRDVWFKYTGRDKGVLEGVNLQLKQGKILALTGVSGSGKSTLAALLSRLYEPSSGCVMLDGVDVTSLNPSWLRQQVGVVDQEPVLFSGSIADNIRYGVPTASDEEVQNAARQANAHDFIMAFPGGYSTEVGDQGRQLSGGEKQRVAIARAVLKDPPVLVLDEATSALDAESERLVSEAIDRLVAHRTVLVIAHRQTTVKKADQVAILQDGRIVESGTYESLMANPSGLLTSLMEGSGTGKRQ